jgi:hypothetical protein
VLGWESEKVCKKNSCETSLESFSIDTTLSISHYSKAKSPEASQRNITVLKYKENLLLEKAEH